jgi:hypothetical protein
VVEVDLSPSHTLPAVFVLGVVDTAAALGASRPSLLAASGLAPSQLSTPDALVPVSAVFATWEAAMARASRPGVADRVREAVFRRELPDAWFRHHDGTDRARCVQTCPSFQLHRDDLRSLANARRG